MRLTTTRRLFGAGSAVLLGGLLVLVTTEWTRSQQAPPPEGPPQITGNTRQSIITDQFTTVTSGALQARSPGTFVQQGVAMTTGNLDLIDGNVVDQPSFIRDTIDQIITQIFDMFAQLLQGLNALIPGASGLPGLPGGLPSAGGATGGGTVPTLNNPLTSGGGGSVPIQ
ncbi:MAG: hypothetical protein ACE5E1_04525 [Phycisphaerae bacterium]